MPIMDAPVLPICDCGKLKTERNGYWACLHCDGPCHNACDPEQCAEPHNGCKDCVHYRAGARKRIIDRYYGA